MKIHSFIKRLNATELGLGVTNDTYIAIPNEVNLSDICPFPWHLSKDHGQFILSVIEFF